MDASQQPSLLTQFLRLWASLQMQSDAIEDGPVYIIEQEEELAENTLRISAGRCQPLQRPAQPSLGFACRQSSGGYPARQGFAALVAKLCQANRASANLTEDGYRRNREIFGAVDSR